MCPGMNFFVFLGLPKCEDYNFFTRKISAINHFKYCLFLILPLSSPEMYSLYFIPFLSQYPPLCPAPPSLYLPPGNSSLLLQLIYLTLPMIFFNLLFILHFYNFYLVIFKTACSIVLTFSSLMFTSSSFIPLTIGK